MADVDTAKTEIIRLRLTPDEKEDIRVKAGKAGVSMSRYLVLAGCSTTFRPESGTSPPAESRTSPQAPRNDLQRRIKAKMARGKTSKLAEIEAREELGL